MFNTVKQYLATVGAVNDKAALGPFLLAIADRMSSQATSTAGLVIFGAASALAKTGAAAFAGVANGVPVAIAASTTLPALTGITTTAAGRFIIAAFFVDAAGVVTVAGGGEGTTLATATFPQFPVGRALVGYLVITSAAAFVGGTTALDTATTVFVSPVGAFDPTIILG